MENYNEIQTRASLSLPADLLEEFKNVLDAEGISIPKAIGQFMLNYTNHLDKRFIKTRKHGKKKSVHYIFLYSEEIVMNFKEKAKREKARPSVLVAQFMRNYVDFIKMNEEKHRTRS